MVSNDDQICWQLIVEVALLEGKNIHFSNVMKQLPSEALRRLYILFDINILTQKVIEAMI